MKTMLPRLLVAGLIPILGGAAPVPEGGVPATLYYFFSPECPGADEAARRAMEYVKGRQGMTLRPVLLVEDFKAFRQVGEESPLPKAVKALGGDVDIPLYDEEGLKLAKAWRINRVPALVLVQGGRAHAGFGTRADSRELEECR